MPKKFEDFDNPRQKAIDGMKNSISETLWNKNLNFLKELRAEISNHPVSKHPAIQLLNDGLIDKETLKHIHLEYRHAIVQVFTDALLMAQFQTKQLEPRLLSGSKMYPRFLLNLNILDEFGFRPPSVGRHLAQSLVAANTYIPENLELCSFYRCKSMRIR